MDMISKAEVLATVEHGIERLQMTDTFDEWKREREVLLDAIRNMGVRHE